MTALKGADIERFVAKPERQVQIVYIYGADGGVVNERAKKIRASYGAGDDFSQITLDASTLTAYPARLLDEATTISLFGDKRVIRVLAETANISESLQLLLAAPTLEAYVVIEAGDVKPAQAVRSLCEKSPRVIALPCYADGVGELSRLIELEVQAAGLRITQGAKELLLTQLGGDRALSRQEIGKLTLYKMGEGEISEQDVRDILSDASGLVLGDMFDAAFTGKVNVALSELKKALGSDESPVLIQLSLLRQLQALLQMRIKLDKGGSARDIVESAQPRVHFSRKATVEMMLKKWALPAIHEEIEKSYVLMRETRLSTALTPVYLERAILRIGMKSR